jgi:hypothetical protein
VVTTYGEAVGGFWGRVIHRFTSSLRSLLEGRVDKSIQSAASAIADARAGDAGSDNMNKMLAIGGVATTLGVSAVAAVKASAAAVAGGGAAVLLTGANIVDVARTRAMRDMTPYYHAAGVTLNRDEKIRF